MLDEEEFRRWIIYEAFDDEGYGEDYDEDDSDFYFEDEDYVLPMDNVNIAAIPTTLVDKEMFDMGSSCPVCMDNLCMEESVCKLGCGHLFHGYCIKHWLGLHASCPVCRWVEGHQYGEEIMRGW